MTASAEVSEATFEAPRRAPDSDDDDEDSDDDGADWVATRVGDDLPVSHEIVMKDHHKVGELRTPFEMWSSCTLYRPSLPSQSTRRARVLYLDRTTMTPSCGTFRG